MRSSFLIWDAPVLIIFQRGTHPEYFSVESKSPITAYVREVLPLSKGMPRLKISFHATT